MHLYAICWNESRMLGFFFRHYLPWVDRFVIYDDGSTDNSIAILSTVPNVEVRPFPLTHPDSFVLSARELQNNCWKESRGHADWVVITAIDEHLYHPNIQEYLFSCTKGGITAIPALGYQMLSDEFPAAHEYLAASRTRGAPFQEMNKLSLFDPDSIEETNFEVGRHRADPTGKVVVPKKDVLLLLHYKCLGRQYLMERNSFLAGGLKQTDRDNSWGHQYSWSEERYREELDLLGSAAVDLSQIGSAAWKKHPGPKWWRQPRPWWKFRRK